MRVLVVTPWFPTANRPAAGSFIWDDVALLSKDHDVVVLHAGAPEDLAGSQPDLPGLQVIRVPFHQSRPKTWYGAAQKIRRLSRQAELVHSMALPVVFPVWLARTRLPWVHTEHYGMLLAEHKTPRQRRAIRVMRQLLAAPDHVVAVSKHLARVAMVTRKGGPTSVIENEVSVAPGIPRGPQGEAAPGQEIRMVAVGGLDHHKGPVEAVETLAELRCRGWDATLTWVGDGKLRDVVQARAQQLGVAVFVNLVGSVPPLGVASFLEEANLFILPTAHETFGIALAEALGHGLPVVTSGVGAHLEFLPPKGSRVAPVRTAAALANAVEALVGDPARMTTMELIRYAQARFDNERRRLAYEEVYHGLE